MATRIYPPEQAAAAFRLGALVQALESRAAQVTVLTTRSGGSGPAAVSNTRTRLSRWPVLRDRSGAVRGYLPYLSFDLPLILRTLVVPRPDVVVVEPPPTTGAVVRAVLSARAALSTQRRSVPYVYYAADVWSDASAATGAPRAVVSALGSLERFALEGASQVIAVSDGVAERVRALGARSVQVVPNGVDARVFTPDPSRAWPGPTPSVEGIPPGPFLLYAGTASEWQGAEIFAEAMGEVVRHYPDATLVFLGQGSAWPRLRRIAESAPKGAVELHPLVAPPVAAAWHRAAVAALVSVRPGLDYDFAYPTKVLAALACGTPVIYAGPGPAADDLHRDHLGTAVPYDREAVAAAMTQALGAASEPLEANRRAQWVRRHRSIGATAQTAAEIVLTAAAAPGEGSPRPRFGARS